MKLRNSMVALLAAGVLLSGCEAQKPSSTSDNAVPASNAAAVPLFEPLAQDATKIPFPVDLLFADSANGNVAAPVDPGASNASVIQALNTSSGFSTTAMMTIPFSAPLDPNQDFSTSIQIFWAAGMGAPAGNFSLAGVEQAGACMLIPLDEEHCTTAAVLTASPTAIPHLITPASATTSLTYGVDFVAQASGNTLAIVPLKPLQQATSYIVVVKTSLKSADGKSIAADAQYADARAGTLAPLANSLTPKIQLQETLSGVPSADIALTYSVTTQNITAAIAQAQGQLATPTISLAPVPVYTMMMGAFANANSALNSPAAIQTACDAVTDTSPLKPLCSMWDGLGGLLNAPTTTTRLANVYVGKVTGMTSFLDPNDPANSTWQGSNPVASTDKTLNAINQYKADPRGTVDVPVIVTVPTAAASCVAPYSVTIYQHGITSDRATVLALGRSLAARCQVTVAIDLPEHGVTTSGNQLDQLLGGISQIIAGTAGTPGDLTSFLAPERLVTMGAAPGGNCMTGAKVASLDGRPAVCPAGDSYINLFNLANARDVLRQSVIDLDSLYKAVNGVTTLAGASIDNTKISFVGMSLGSIVGETFVATLANPGMGGSLKAAVFNVGGGGIAKLLDGSPTFEPVITGGLAAQGVTKPSADYESFLMVAQTLVDSADPINYADTLNALKATTPILFQEVVGNGSSNDPDQVVPNNVFGAATGSLGGAWSTVSGSPVQAAVWASQNPLTNPSVLGGADSLVQGTAFVPVATIANTAGHPLQATAGACVAVHDTQCNFGGAISPFYGIGLPQVGSTGALGSGLVRFDDGTHGSLLDPSSSQLVTVMMQAQVAHFIGSAVAGGAQIAGESACTPLIGVACTDTIADW